MSSQVMLNLPDDLLRTAETVARRDGRPVADVLVDAVKSSLRPLAPAADVGKPIADRSDAEVLAATELTMPPAQDARLSDLLGEQREGTITPDGRVELASLMQVYQEGLLTKARALREAVQRGLRKPLES